MMTESKDEFEIEVEDGAVLRNGRGYIAGTATYEGKDYQWTWHNTTNALGVTLRTKRSAFGNPPDWHTVPETQARKLFRLRNAIRQAAAARYGTSVGV